MIILCDSREQKVLFQGDNFISLIYKLDEGDYNIPELLSHIVIERKTCQDFYGTLTKGHERFKQEILRSRIKQKSFYIFVEGTEEYFYSMKWSKKYLKCRPKHLAAMINTMQDRYALKILWCQGPRDMEDKILECFKLNKKLYDVDWSKKMILEEQLFKNVLTIMSQYNRDYGSINVLETKNHLIISFYNGGYSYNEELDSSLRSTNTPAINNPPISIYTFNKLLLDPIIYNKLDIQKIKKYVYKYNLE